MTNTTNNKTSQTSRERMLRALFQLLQERKLQEISVSELCALTKINRTTFYNHYDNIAELARDARKSIEEEYASQFAGNTDGYTPANLLIMFQYIYENQILYRIYFQLNPSYVELLGSYDQELARQHYPGQHAAMIRYHAEFFAAGLTAIIQRWLANGCRETPEEMARIVTSEYKTRG